MRLTRRYGYLIALLVGLSVPLAAQTVAPLAMLKFVSTLSQRVDRLQRRADAALGTHAFANIDGVNQSETGVVHVVGWGLGCGYADARIVLVVDDVETANGVGRPARADVNAAYASTCNVIGNTGVDGLVDMAAFEPGFLSNHAHTMKIRVYPPAWTSVTNPPFAMAESAPVTFVSW
jgi:hypothetical protein